MKSSEIEIQLEYLGLVKEETIRKRVSRFISDSFIEKKILKHILSILEASEQYQDTSHIEAKLFRQEAINLIKEKL